MHNVVFCIGLFLFCTSCFANNVEISVYGHDERGLANTMVYLLPKDPVTAKTALNMAIMDQVNTQFLPHILAVQKQASVRFPHSDSIKHHVYSFSTAKVFELQRYKGLQAEPLLFSKTGVVELGCNVHDWMLGYIYVVDTPYFAKTDIDGRAQFDVPNGEYEVNTWHPRIQDNTGELALKIEVHKDMAKTIIIPSKLLPSLQPFQNETDEFFEYE
jgi:plastocyanin